MIIGGRGTDVNVPVICTGNRETGSVTIAGTTWTLVKTFAKYTVLYEILVKIPALAGAVSLEFGLFDPDYLADGEERWNSGAVAESACSCVALDRVIVPGNLLKVKANAGAGTEAVPFVLYEAGI